MNEGVRLIARDLLLFSRLAVGKGGSFAGSDPVMTKETLDVAGKNRLGALVGAGVGGAAAGLSEELVMQLRALKATAVARDLESGSHMEAFLSELSEAALVGQIAGPIVVLKGTHLRRTVYAGIPYARERGDVDVLIEDRDFPVVREILLGFGMRRVRHRGPWFHLGMKHDEDWVGTLPTGKTLSIDLHRGLIHKMRAAPPVDALFQAAELLPGAPLVHGLSPVHCAAHCALHLGNDSFRGGFRGLVDLDLLVLEEGLTPDDFSLDDPVVSRCRSVLFVAFSMLHTFFGDADPRYLGFSNKFRPSTLRWRSLLGALNPDNFVTGEFENLARLRKALMMTALIDSPPHRWFFPFYRATIAALKKGGF